MKITGKVAVTYFYDPKGHGDLCGQFDLDYDPIRIAKEIRGRRDLQPVF